MDDGTARVVIPYAPRSHFRPYHDRTKRFSCIVAHRRAGKTVACINDLLRGALTCTKPEPRFAYIAPTFTQAKDVAWEYLKKFAHPVMEYGGDANESELRVDLPNGGRVRLYGAENFDRLRGLYLDGVVLDEFGTMDPRVWEVVRPALSDRQGGCTWIGTPRGHNAFYEVWQSAQTDEEYFAAMLKASETGILPAAELERARKDLSPEAYAQEYECSFEAAIPGAYFGKEMELAENEKRITRVPYDKGLQVHTAWDLGMADSTAIWFIQVVGREWRFIDYLEGSGVGLDWYARELQKKPYVYGEHVCPHDVEVKELGTGKSRKEILAGLGIRCQVAPKLPLPDGIQAARVLIGKSVFDREKCKQGIEALKQYRREFDDKNKAFKVRPLHDWTSHAADAFRYAATGLKPTNNTWKDYAPIQQVSWIA